MGNGVQETYFYTVTEHRGTHDAVFEAIIARGTWVNNRLRMQGKQGKSAEVNFFVQ